MTQLKDDCFAFGGELLSLDDALADLNTRLEPAVETESVVITEAGGRFLAEDITAPRDVPPHDNSAVDGYAVYFDDLDPEAETRLPVTGRIAAGHPLERDAVRGEALRIFTGAPMPGGTEGGPDTVFMEEDCTVDDDFVLFPPGLKRGANRRLRGEDIEEGAIILARGARLRAQEIGVAASVGRADLSVFRRLKAAIFSTGDEVRDPSGDAPEGCIFDSNRFSVMSLLAGLGCEITDLGILPDDEATIASTLGEAAGSHDLLVTSGGVSAGEEDHVKAAVEGQGTLHFWRFAIKPGRPVALGQVGATPFIGLPGNPVAAMVTFMVIARPMILRLSGARDVNAPRYPVEAGFDHKKKTGRLEWVRAALSTGADGRPVVRKNKAGGSGILTSMVEADGLVEFAEHSAGCARGDTVRFLPFNEVA